MGPQMIPGKVVNVQREKLWKKLISYYISLTEDQERNIL